MKKVICIFSFCALSVATAYSQDDNYYQNSNADNYNNTNTYNNSEANGIIGPAEVYDDAGNNQNYNAFYDQLRPYGNWVNYAGYGYVWVPADVPADFSPYVTAGQWVYTDAGWTWASDYDWGWAAFHYGRWFRDNTYGWMWMPGNEWAPAWVSWGSYDNYYCWAPMAPYANYNYSGYYNNNYYSWNFVSRDHFCNEHVGYYIENRNVYGHGDFRNINAHVNIINDAHAYGNHHYGSGPRVNEVAQVTGHSITPLAINNVSHASATHINGSQINVYRPEIRNQVMHNNNQAMQNQQFHQQPVNNPVRNQDFNSHSMVQNPVREQQYNRPNNNIERPVNTIQQYQRPVNQSQHLNAQCERNNAAPQGQIQQQYNQPARVNAATSNYSAPQRNFQQSQMQRQPERNFASMQRTQAPSTSFAGGHNGRR